MLYNRLINSKNLHSNPIVVLIAKISFDTIFYGNMSLSPFVTGIMCYFGALKLGEIIFELYNCASSKSISNECISIKDQRIKSTDAESESEYTRVNNKVEELEEVDYDELIQDADTIVKRSQELINAEK